MKFDAPLTGRTYSDRAVDDSWKSWCEATLVPAGKDIVDIGCGGGIYSLEFSILGAKSVIGIDSSRQYIEEAVEAARGRPNVAFRIGTSAATYLDDRCADLVFERALIHHLTHQEQRENARETLRILRTGGCLVVQDRTYADIVSPHADFWIRRVLFELFPRLLDFERERRPSSADYSNLLHEAGFKSVKVQSYFEIRKRYASFSELRDEVLARKGKSILFKLADGSN